MHEHWMRRALRLAQQAAESLRSWRLQRCTLYVTLEPCPMCAAARSSKGCWPNRAASCSATFSAANGRWGRSSRTVLGRQPPITDLADRSARLPRRNAEWFRQVDLRTRTDLAPLDRLIDDRLLVEPDPDLLGRHPHADMIPAFLFARNSGNRHISRMWGVVVGGWDGRDQPDSPAPHGPPPVPLRASRSLRRASRSRTCRAPYALNSTWPSAYRKCAPPSCMLQKCRIEHGFSSSPG